MFRKSVIISLLGHLTVFSIFSLSFGTVIPRANFAPVSFWGAVLGGSQVAAPRQLWREPGLKNKSFSAKPQTQTLKKVSAGQSPARSYYLKPPLNPAFSAKKSVPVKAPPVLPLSPEKREPMILFHPVLPYGFGLYFKDRQVAHVELLFNIEPGAGSRNSIAVKRRISSGNLEVDLLCMRYIGHYLFIEQERFAQNSWQAVKIDLSRKDD